MTVEAKERAVANLKQLLNAAVQKGILESSAVVVQLHSDLDLITEIVKESMQQDSKGISGLTKS